MLMHRSELSFNLTSNRYLLILLFLPCNISGVSSLHYCFTTWELFKVTYVHLRVISTLQSHILIIYADALNNYAADPILSH